MEDPSSAYLVEGGKSVHVGRVDIRAFLQELQHLVLVPRGAGRQEDAARRELDLPSLAVRVDVRLAVRLRVLPTFELFRSLEKSRTRTTVHRHGNAHRQTILHSIRVPTEQ